MLVPPSSKLLAVPQNCLGKSLGVVQQSRDAIWAQSVSAEGLLVETIRAPLAHTCQIPLVPLEDILTHFGGVLPASHPGNGPLE